MDSIKSQVFLQKAFTNLLYLQWKGDCLTGALWIMAYKFLITVAVKPPWCLSEEWAKNERVHGGQWR